MTYGLRMFSDAGKLAYSTELPTLHFMGKYTVGQSTVAGGVIFTTTVTGIRAGSSPVVFVCDPSNTAFVSVVSTQDLGGGSWQVTAAAAVNPFTSSWPASVDLFVFAPPPARTPAAGEYGMRVFDAAGLPTVDTARRFLKIAGFGVSVPLAGTRAHGDYSTFGLTTLTYGVIPTNWATSAQIIGRLRMSFGPPPPLPGTPIPSVLSTLGVRKYSGSEFEYQANRYVTLAYSNSYNGMEWWIDGTSYIMFIDTDAYNATTGTY